MKRKAPTTEPGSGSLQIRKAASGELLVAVSSEVLESFKEVRALKRFLQPLCGLPRFRQRLLFDGQVLKDDDAVPAAPADVQLVLLNFCKPEPESEAELHDAAFVGSTLRVEAALQRPEDPNADGLGDSPLTAAAYSGQIDVVRLLLEARADTGMPEDESQTPLEAASELGYQDIVRLLLESRADGGTPRVTLETPIWLASSSGHEEIVRLLLEAGAPTEASYDDGETPLLQACERGHLATAAVLLNANADVNTRGEGGRTPLREACEGGHLDIVRLLSRAGGDAHAADDLGRTPLAAAEQQGETRQDDILARGFKMEEAVATDVPPELLKNYNEVRLRDPSVFFPVTLAADVQPYIPAQWHHAVLTVPDESCIALSLNLWYHRIDDVEAVINQSGNWTRQMRRSLACGPMSASMGIGAIQEVPAPLTRPYAGMESFSPRMSQAKHDKWEQTASLLREAMHAQTAAHAQALQEQQDSHVDRHRQLQRDMEALKMAHAKDQKAKEQFIRQLRSDVQDLKQSHEGTLQAQKERFQRQLEAKATSLQELQDNQQEIWGVLQDMDMAHDKALEEQKLYYERALQEREADFQRRLQEKDESHQRQELLATTAAESSGREAQEQKQHYERLLKEKDESHQRQVQELAATKAAEGSDREVQEQKQNYERLLQEKDDSHQRQMQELLASKAAERGGQKEEAANPVLAANTAAHGSGRETQATGEPQAPDEASAKQKARASLIQAARDGSLEKSLQDFRQKVWSSSFYDTLLIWKTTTSDEEQFCQGRSDGSLHGAPPYPKGSAEQHK
ncbi:Homeobox protein Wariai [Symbiodinium microadriaticum]|uniref:Homeobox protein Wariai n=1 Tax=Symbiodinium microadriaticum TaxID=2951 RepID=A0A1Q9F7L2_SYMMI|nr:Homeobox protein Wariai [Symbiodinium microadriaticum]